MAMIDQRPAEADDRRVPGHREGDLILGAGNPLGDRHAGSPGGSGWLVAVLALIALVATVVAVTAGRGRRVIEQLPPTAALAPPASL